MPIPLRTVPLAHPRIIQSLKSSGRFPWTAEIQSPTVTQSTKSGAETYTWADVDDMGAIPCLKYDRVPREERTIDIIIEVKLFTIALAGYYPTIKPSWRCILKETGEIFDIIGQDSDSLKIMTILTVRDINTAVQGV